ncbi:MAG: hypothetical protein M1837_004707 [Sclerophora amabilis]|nr:MAG: hypothetical protein M1837_004707 [Sclerophora amabilis]
MLVISFLIYAILCNSKFAKGRPRDRASPPNAPPPRSQSTDSWVQLPDPDPENLHHTVETGRVAFYMASRWFDELTWDFMARGSFYTDFRLPSYLSGADDGIVLRMSWFNRQTPGYEGGYPPPNGNGIVRRSVTIEAGADRFDGRDASLRAWLFRIDERPSGSLMWGEKGEFGVGYQILRNPKPLVSLPHVDLFDENGSDVLEPIDEREDDFGFGNPEPPPYVLPNNIRAYLIWYFNSMLKGGAVDGF